MVSAASGLGTRCGLSSRYCSVSRFAPSKLSPVSSSATMNPSYPKCQPTVVPALKPFPETPTTSVRGGNVQGG